jgi:AcrR family transcriptional regulator
MGATDRATTRRPSARRPRDRRDQLAALAVQLFCKHGYHAVGINDIASAAGITGPALYRHFSGKQALLAHVLLDGLDTVDEVAERTLDDRDQPPEARLRAFTRGVAVVAVEKREIAALWRRELRHLSEEHRGEVRRRGDQWMSRTQAALREVRPELSEQDADMLCLALLSVYGSLADHHAVLPKKAFVPLMTGLADDVLATRLPESAEPGLVRTPAAPFPSPTRREQLLTSAMQLFRQRGFHAVTMEDIGRATGLAAASVYRHFPSKAELLLAGCRRMADRLLHDASTALAGADGPEAALNRLLESYVDTVVRNRDLLVVYNSEVGNLPAPERTELIRLQRAYVTHWVRLRTQTAPELGEAAARITVHVALTVVNDLIRTSRTAARAGLAAELAGLARTALTGPGVTPAADRSAAACADPTCTGCTGTDGAPSASA